MFSCCTGTVAFLVLVCVITVYGGRPYGGDAPYAAPYSAPATVVALPLAGEAQAQADSNAASARSAAARLRNSNRYALHQYGHQIGYPLLARPYGVLTNLYAAALPPRSFVGQIDPGFERDYNGVIRHVGQASIAVAAI